MPMKKRPSVKRKEKRVVVYMVAADRVIYDSPAFTDQQKAVIELINGTFGWKYAGIYIEIAGERNEFERLLEDCQSGRVDVIVTKTMLQFGSSFIECIDTAQMLSQAKPPVEIIFTDEAVFTSDMETLAKYINCCNQGEDPEKV